MSSELIKLHPKNYIELKGKLFFYVDQKYVNQQRYENFCTYLQKAKSLVVTAFRKNNESGYYYYLYLENHVMRFSESKSEKINFYSSKIAGEQETRKRREKLYKTKIFTIIPAEGVYTIYGKQITPAITEGENVSWDMAQNVYDELRNKMESYFNAEDEEDEEETFSVTPRFKNNIVRPFRYFTEKENWVEQYRQACGVGIEYFKRSYRESTNKGTVYDFYSIDSNANPEDGMMNIGDRVTIIDTMHGDRSLMTGVINEIDAESTDAVIFSIVFYHQINDEDFPVSGKIVMAVNDTQSRVRSKVINGLERKRVESKYMYKTFTDFSVAGYEEVPEDLLGFLSEKMADKYPPNQMQLEAIIKGILTDDLLLVLGPPGTGKTTVISFWVEYFVKKGYKVLISSQNNAAVDNVLARFKKEKNIEIVRLGNENKVQEDCKDLLPHNKIASMQEHYEQNAKRVWEALAHDELEINAYRERLNTYVRLKAEWDAIDKNSISQRGIIESRMRDLKKYMSESIQIKNEYENVRIQIARKQIFLEIHAQKNPIIRFLHFGHANNVKKELKLLDMRQNVLLQNYKHCLESYRKSVEAVKNILVIIRIDGTIEKYNKAKADLENFILSMQQAEFLPCFESELKYLYEPVQFLNDKSGNLNIVSSEKSVMDYLEKTIEKMRSALGDWQNMIDNERNDILQNALLETCQIVGATCIGINSNRAFANVKFDVAIVDESGQIQIHNALIPMSRARKNLLLGDYKQIPPCANEEVESACKAEGVDTTLLNMSFFEHLFVKLREKEIKKLEEQGEDRTKILRPVLEDYIPKPYQTIEKSKIAEMIQKVTGDGKKLVNLNSQFRMPGNISDIISEWFYENNYFSSYDMSGFHAIVPGTEKPLVVVSTSKSGKRWESQPESKMGYQNAYEAELIANIVEKVVMSQKPEQRMDFCENIEHHIGIISAYGAQVRLIREYLAKKDLDIKSSQIRSMVASLDSFQGQERPLILYSLTRSTNYKEKTKGRVGFMKELRRLNVAFTRCKKQLIIVGDIDYLKECRNMEKVPEDREAWPCADKEENDYVSQFEIEQCAECPAVCERKFARFMRLLMQHVDNGDGDILDSDDMMKMEA